MVELNMFGLRYIPEVVTLTLNADLCNGCRKCTMVCPHAVFVVENRCTRIDDKNACMECGACERNCSEGAISVTAGVGCASGIITGAIRGTEPTCDCTDGPSCC